MRRRRISRDREFAGMRVLAQRGARLGHKLDDFLDKNHIPHASSYLKVSKARHLANVST